MAEKAGRLRWALVTGATGGIGAEMSRQLARRGYALVLAGRSETGLMALAARLRDTAADVRTVTADLSEPGGASELIGKVDALGIEPELLVNNAGLGYTAPFVESDLERQRALVQLDVTSPMELCHEYGARMARRGRGAILNVASVAGVMPGPGMSTYFASKSFVLSLSQALHEELRPRGVQVMALCPGPVSTRFWDVAGNAAARATRVFLSPTEVCAIALVALERGRTACAPGPLSKVCYGFGRVAPYLVSRKVAGALTGRQRREG